MKITYSPVLDRDGKLDRFFRKENGFVEVNPGSVVMPRKFCEIGEAILDFPVRNDDCWLISYPRTGSTWAQEIIWLLCNNFDYEGAKKMQALRAPLLELSAIFHEDHKDWLNESIGTESVECVKNMPSPRFIKSHLPWQLLPSQLSTVKPRVIYIARNPKDLCVSFYYYCQLIHGLTGTFDEFCEIFLNNQAPIGAFWPHVLDFWKRQADPNILFLKYEDMKTDLPQTIRDLARFLNVDDILTEEHIPRICEHVRFEKMQQNPAVNLEPILKLKQIDTTNESVRFIRKGQIGDWRNYMNDSMSARFDKWIFDSTSTTDLRFIYE